jgi:hypothetical protein
MAILADYMLNKQVKALPDYLSDKVFADAKVSVVEPNIEEVEGFNRFLQNYQSCLSVEKKAVKTLQ